MGGWYQAVVVRVALSCLLGPFLLWTVDQEAVCAGFGNLQWLCVLLVALL
jgi:hypothetical protein